MPLTPNAINALFIQLVAIRDSMVGQWSAVKPVMDRGRASCILGVLGILKKARKMKVS